MDNKLWICFSAAISIFVGTLPCNASTFVPQISWFPNDMETLICCKRPFQFRFAEFSGQGTDDRPGLDRLPLISLLDLPIEVQQNLDGCEITLALAASKNFKVPTFVGGNDYEGGLILRLSKPLENTFLDCVKKLSPKPDVAGSLSIYKLQNSEDDSIQRFLALPENNLLIVGTTPQFVRSVLERMNRTHADISFAKNLPEWSFVNPNSIFFAIRHYRRPTSDPQSPLSSANSEFPDNNAIGLVCCSDSYFNTGSVQIVCLSRKDNLKKGLLKFLLRVKSTSIKSRAIAQSANQISLSISNQSQWISALLLLSGLLGHAENL